MTNAVGRVGSVLVLGAGSDIATSVVRRLVARGTDVVVLAGRHPDAYETFAREVQESGARTVEIMHFDAAETNKHRAFAEQVFEKFEDVDLALIAFGVLGSQEQLERDPRGASEVVEANYVGAVSVALAVAERMQQQGHGTLVFFSSVAAIRPRRSNFIYGSSKAGLDFFARGLADCLRGTGVRVMVVRPGFVASKMTAGLPRPPLATDTETVATAVVGGLATGAGIVWVPRVLRWVSLALRAVPSSLLRRLRL